MAKEKLLEPNSKPDFLWWRLLRTYCSAKDILLEIISAFDTVDNNVWIRRLKDYVGSVLVYLQSVKQILLSYAWRCFHLSCFFTQFPYYCSEKWGGLSEHKKDHPSLVFYQTKPLLYWKSVVIRHLELIGLIWYSDITTNLSRSLFPLWIMFHST